AGRILLNYVVWGNGGFSARLWNAIRSDDWAIPHVGLSSLGEIVVWGGAPAFPPPNKQTTNRPVSYKKKKPQKKLKKKSYFV
ncbi:hypothetical protein ACVGWD_03265, partial [Enterobacter asburiae]